jgi:molecular chaperone GrpE
MDKKDKKNESKKPAEKNEEDLGQLSSTQANSDEFEKLKTDFDNLQNQLKRAVADYQNLEKRVADGRAELASWANTELLKKLVQVLDYYDKALEGASEEDKKSGWFRGVELATQQLRNALQSEGLEQVGADGPFDPTLHEAVDAKEGEENMILEVVEKGYNLNGKILRPAKVVVGKKGN